jgi:hypothetical protein
MPEKQADFNFVRIFVRFFLVQLTRYPFKSLAVLISIAGLALVQAGCQQRAYTDFYTESMAGEIRELENRIYEYDDAYQSIEQELSLLEAENAELHQQLMTLDSSASKRNAGQNSSLLKGFGAGSFEGESIQPVPMRESQAIEIPSADHLPPPVKGTPKPTPSIVPKTEPAISPAPVPSKPTPGKEKAKSFNEPTVPLIEPGVPSDSLPKALQPRNDSTILPSTSPPNSRNESPAVPNSLQAPSDGMKAPNFPIFPPATNGTSLPSRSDAANVRQASVGLPSDLDPHSISQGRIEMPQIVAPATYSNSKAIPSKSVADTKPVVDTKVVEIGFHPTLCRGQNLNKEDGDDGLYLVLQPRNQSSEIIDQPAAVTIVAMDPKRPPGEARIGRWTLSEQEIEAALEPIGISHGYHISLPWQETMPLGDMVQVHVRYEMQDGRRLINERRIQLHVPSTASSVWTPRVPR